MDFITENSLLIMLALTSAFMLFWNSKQSLGGGLSVNDTVHAMNREKAVVIDLDEAAVDSIKGAKRLGLAELAEKLPSLVKKKDSKIIFIGTSGMRTKSALAIASKLGYENATQLKGGMQAWRAANMPVQTIEAQKIKA